MKMTEQQDKTNVTPDPKHITAKDYYDYLLDGYGWFSRIPLLVLFFMGFLMPFLWIFFVITLITDKKQEAQYGVILKSGAKGVINIKGKYNITKFESELAQAKYL
jgi:hypothetical protein